MDTAQHRDDIIEVMSGLSGTRGQKVLEVAALMGITKRRVNQILSHSPHYGSEKAKVERRQRLTEQIEHDNRTGRRPGAR